MVLGHSRTTSLTFRMSSCPMQLPAAHRRYPAPLFVNHTPREFEMTTHSTSSSPDMPLLTFFGTSLGAAPSYTNDIMGQTPSEIARPEIVRQTSTSIFREYSTYVEDEPRRRRQSSPDSHSIHHDCTDQRPYTLGDFQNGDKMMTQTSFLRVPKENDSRDLAFFLRTTGPTAPHRRATKLQTHRRGLSASKPALKLFKLLQKKTLDPVMTAHNRLNIAIRDEGGLLPGIHDDEDGDPISESLAEPLVIKGAEQKLSSTGKRYMAVQIPPQPENASVVKDTPLVIGPDILESTVSISFTDGMSSTEILDSWHLTLSRSTEKLPYFDRDPAPGSPLNPDRYAIDQTKRQNDSPRPIRPAASSPPTPLLPEPAYLDLDTYHDYALHSPLLQPESSRARDSRPFDILSQDEEIPVTTPENEHDFPVRRQSPQKDAKIVSPSPKRFVSHPVLLQRASSMSSSVYPPSTAESPGPPPPKSPLRLCRDERTINGVMATSHTGSKSGRKTGSGAAGMTSLAAQRSAMRPTVVTDCTGPIKRPKSRSKDKEPGLSRHPVVTISRKEREERIRARKLQDKPSIARTIDAVVNAPVLNSRQRVLRRLRPQIQIPELRPAPLVTRMPSSDSSVGGWRNATETTRTPVSPVSPVPSEEFVPWCIPGKQRTPVSPVTTESLKTNNEDKTGYTPITPSTTHTTMTLSPVMLIAEEVPLPRAKPSPSATKIVVKEGKGYAPRPRSASMSRGAMRRRSRAPSRSATPGEGQKRKELTPPLPSPPPNRSLPPTPPASGSERTGRLRSLETKKELPILPLYEISPADEMPQRQIDRVPHVVTQAQQSKASSPRNSNKGGSRVDARLEALEKQNALLSAALTAVLQANGTINSGTRGDSVSTNADIGKIPTAWAWRIARRSTASNTASNSSVNTSKLYATTRYGGVY